MERILILMQAANWAEATEALTSARENALHRNALSYALVLPEAPTAAGGSSQSPDIPRRMQYGGVRGAAIPCQPGNDFCCDGNALARRTLCAAGASGDAL